MQTQQLAITPGGMAAGGGVKGGGVGTGTGAMVGVGPPPPPPPPPVPGQPHRQTELELSSGISNVQTQQALVKASTAMFCMSRSCPCCSLLFINRSASAGVKIPASTRASTIDGPYSSSISIKS